MNKKDKKRYKNLLLDSTVSYDKINEEKRNWLPKYIYRYYSFNSHWEQNLFEGIVHCESPCCYNDPFDGWFAFTMLPQILDIELTDDIRQDILIGNAVIRKQLKNACFSEKNDSILMWSHYSSKHAGFCIEYDTTLIPELIWTFLFPVAYTKTLYDASLLRLGIMKEKLLKDYKNSLSRSLIAYLDSISDDYFVNICLNPTLFKSKEWEYEAEWRLCSNDNMDQQIFSLNADHNIDMLSCISAVYLGAEFHDSKRLEGIKDWAIVNRKRVYQMEKSASSFSLNAMLLYAPEL